jgi:hypothetical protein
VHRLIRPRCGGAMKVVAFLANQAIIDRIIDHLRSTFIGRRTLVV